ncbi:hypothetical protein ABVT39_005103 [Epinephelus coioides]
MMQAELRLQHHNESSSSFSRQSLTQRRGRSNTDAIQRQQKPTLSVSPGQQSGICPSGPLGRWSKNPPPLGDRHKAQQTSPQRPIQAWGNNVAVPTRIPGNTPNNMSGTKTPSGYLL